MKVRGLDEAIQDGEVTRERGYQRQKTGAQGGWTADNARVQEGAQLTEETQGLDLGLRRDSEEQGGCERAHDPLTGGEGDKVGGLAWNWRTTGGGEGGADGWKAASPLLDAGFGLDGRYMIGSSPAHIAQSGGEGNGRSRKGKAQGDSADDGGGAGGKAGPDATVEARMGKLQVTTQRWQEAKRALERLSEEVREEAAVRVQATVRKYLAGRKRRVMKRTKEAKERLQRREEEVRREKEARACGEAPWIRGGVVVWRRTRYQWVRCWGMVMQKALAVERRRVRGVLHERYGDGRFWAAERLQASWRGWIERRAWAERREGLRHAMVALQEVREAVGMMVRPASALGYPAGWRWQAIAAQARQLQEDEPEWLSGATQRLGEEDAERMEIEDVCGGGARSISVATQATAVQPQGGAATRSGGRQRREQRELAQIQQIEWAAEACVPAGEQQLKSEMRNEIRDAWYLAKAMKESLGEEVARRAEDSEEAQQVAESLRDCIRGETGRSGGFFYKKCQANGIAVDSRMRDTARIDAVKEAKERAMAYLYAHSRGGRLLSGRLHGGAWASGRLH